MKKIILTFAFIVLLKLTNAQTTYTVTSSADSGPGSLRDAITTLTVTPGVITFSLTPNDTIKLTTTLTIVNSQTLTIDGSGQHVVLSGQDSIRILKLGNSTITLKNLVFCHGYLGSGSGYGAAVLGGNGTHCAIRNCSFINNHVSGGSGIGVTVCFAGSNPFTIYNSTFKNNGVIGGASWVGSCIGYAAMGISGPSNSLIANCTFLDNTGNGIFGTRITFTGGSYPNIYIKNNIFANAPANLVVNNDNPFRILDLGNNISDNTDASGTLGALDSMGLNPMLDTLAGMGYWNGSYTPCMKLLSGSPSIGMGAADTAAELGYDQSGTPRIGHIDAGSVQFTVLGAALNFDGVDDQVNVGSAITTTLSTLGSITAEAWVNPATISAPSFGTIMGNYANPNNELQFLLRQENNRYSFYVDIGAGLQGVSSPVGTATTNVWQHVAGVWDGNKLMIYVNGILQGTTIGVTGATLNSSTTNSVVLGYESAGGGEGFAGSIDEARIWGRAVCQVEIQNNMSAEIAANANSLLAYYKFNQGYDNSDNTAITTLADSSGNAFNGTLNNFALTDTTSNFVSPGGVITGSMAPAFTNSLSAVTTQTNVACHGDATGKASVTASGFTPYTYSWLPSGDTNLVEGNLLAGTYTCSISNGCGIITKTVTITEPAQALAAASTSGTITCNGGATTVTVSATGGTPTYSNTGTFTVTANSYTYTVTDVNSCTATTTITVTQPNPIDTSITISPAYFPILTANATGATYQWVTCGSSTNTPIPGATQQSYTTTSNALSPYAVIITQGTCSAISDCRYDAIIEGIAQYNATNNLQVYPNPFTNELTITSTAKTKAILFDILGNQIHSFNLQNTTQTISLGDLAAGVYYLQVDNSKIKIIKQ